MMVSVAIAVAYGVAAAATLAGGPYRFLRGRHVSRALIRRSSFRVAVTVRTCFPPCGPVIVLLTGDRLAALVLAVALAVWALDDFFFSRDGGKRRKHEWARIRLRMPKPVRLRVVERWAPNPA